MNPVVKDILIQLDRIMQLSHEDAVTIILKAGSKTNLNRNETLLKDVNQNKPKRKRSA